MGTGQRSAFGVRLMMALTEADRREEARERKRGYRVNIYRLGHLLAAGEEVLAAVERGAEPARAFATHFSATADLHRAAGAVGVARARTGGVVEFSPGLFFTTCSVMVHYTGRPQPARGTRSRATRGVRR